jgi:hypothetical protein
MHHLSVIFFPQFFSIFFDGKVRAYTFFRTRAADLGTMARVARPHVANTQGHELARCALPESAAGQGGIIRTQ